jgi:hypothetical protein
MNTVSYSLLMTSAVLSAVCFFFLTLVAHVESRDIDRWAEYFVPRATLLIFFMVVAAGAIEFWAV